MHNHFNGIKERILLNRWLSFSILSLVVLIFCFIFIPTLAHRASAVDDSASLQQALSMSLSSDTDTVNIDVTPGFSAMSNTLGENTLHVSSNCSYGYYIYATGNTDNNLYLAGNSGSVNYFEPTSATLDAPTTLPSNKWGIALERNTGTFFGITEEAIALRQPVDDAPENEDIDLYYAAAADLSVLGGTYTTGNNLPTVTYSLVPSLNCITVTLHFDAGSLGQGATPEVTGSMEDVITGYGASIVFPENDFERTHFAFMGWSTVDNDDPDDPDEDALHFLGDGSEELIGYETCLPYSVDGVITLYPMWKELTDFILTYDTGGWATIAPQTISTLDDAVEFRVTPVTVETDSDVFLGWSTVDGGYGRTVEYVGGDVFRTSATSNTLYAVWRPSEVTLVFHPNDSVMPQTYEQLEYIISSGDSFIDTGYYPNKNTGIEAEFMYTSVDLQRRLYGTGGDLDVDGLFDLEFYINGRGGWSYSYQDKSGSWDPAYDPDTGARVDADTNKHTLRFNINNDGKYYIDNTTMSGANDIYNFGTSDATYTSSNYPLAILGRYYVWADGMEYDPMAVGMAGRLYSFKIYENGNLVRNYIPARRKSDNVIGLYDSVYGYFYSSLTDTGFAGGPPVRWNWNNYGNSYQEVPYIESHGTEYIDSGYMPNKNTGVKTEFQFTDASRAQQRLFSAHQLNYSISDPDVFTMGFYIGGSSAYYFRYHFQDGTNNTEPWRWTDYPADTVKHKLEFNSNGLREYYISGSMTANAEIETASATMTSSNRSLYIFMAHTDAMPSEQFGRLRLYSFDIYRNGLIVRNYVPSYDINTGELGLYETVNGEFYGNLGEGAFTTNQTMRTIHVTSRTADRCVGTPHYAKSNRRFLGWSLTPDGTVQTSECDEGRIWNIFAYPHRDGSTIHLYAVWGTL